MCTPTFEHVHEQFSSSYLYFLPWRALPRYLFSDVLKGHLIFISTVSFHIAIVVFSFPFLCSNCVLGVFLCDLNNTAFSWLSWHLCCQMQHLEIYHSHICTKLPPMASTTQNGKCSYFCGARVRPGSSFASTITPKLVLSTTSLCPRQLWETQSPVTRIPWTVV